MNTENITFKKFANLCRNFKIKNVRTDLIADYCKICEENNLPVQVGKDNDKESFDIDENTFSLIQLQDRFQVGFYIETEYSKDHAMAGQKELFCVFRRN